MLSRQFRLLQSHAWLPCTSEAAVSSGELRFASKFCDTSAHRSGRWWSPITRREAETTHPFPKLNDPGAVLPANLESSLVVSGIILRIKFGPCIAILCLQLPHSLEIYSTAFNTYQCQSLLHGAKTPSSSRVGHSNIFIPTHHYYPSQMRRHSSCGTGR